MANQKQVTVTVAGSGRTYEVPVTPGDDSEDVLWEVVDDEENYTLRRGNDEVIDSGTDVYHHVDGGEALFAATDPIVG
jgi:hypothetical protein